jgi:chromosome segregation ATPase
MIYKSVVGLILLILLATGGAHVAYGAVESGDTVDLETKMEMRLEEQQRLREQKADTLEQMREKRAETATEKLSQLRESTADRVEEKQEDAEMRRVEAEQRLEEKLRDRCDRIEAHLTEVRSRIEQNRSRHTNVYQKMSARLQQMTVKLSDQGYDTQEVQNLLPEFDQKVAAFESQLGTLDEAVGQAKSFACGEAGRNFGESLSASRAHNEQVREAAADLRSYFRDEIRPALERLKAQNIAE